MKRKWFKKALSAVLSAAMCFTTMLSVSTPVFAATQVDVYMVDFPRDGDTNYSTTAWGHSAANLMSGWSQSAHRYTTVHCLGSYTGQVAYCIEPGVGQYSGDTLTGQGEDYWENYPASNNVTISPDTVKVLLGRIMQYGYQGNVSPSWRSQNADDAEKLSHAIATQLLVWETVVGERDASFNKVDPAAYGADPVLGYVRDDHPLRSQILSYYNSIAASVQNHTKTPSFCSRSVGSASSYEMKYNGSNYSVTLTDANGVLSDYSFSSSEPGVHFSKSGNTLTITAETPVLDTIQVSASKTDGTRAGIVTWTDGIRHYRDSGCNYVWRNGIRSCQRLFSFGNGSCRHHASCENQRGWQCFRDSFYHFRKRYYKESEDRFRRYHRYYRFDCRRLYGNGRQHRQI